MTLTEKYVFIFSRQSSSQIQPQYPSSNIYQQIPQSQYPQSGFGFQSSSQIPSQVPRAAAMANNHPPGFSVQGGMNNNFNMSSQPSQPMNHGWGQQSLSSVPVPQDNNNIWNTKSNTHANINGWGQQLQSQPQSSQQAKAPAQMFNPFA